MQPDKKIVIISDFAYPITGGTEKYVFEEAEFLAKTNKVRIISPVWSPKNKAENFKYRKFSKNLDMIRFKGLLRRNKIIKPLKFLWNLIRYCRDCDVINGHYYSNALVAILFAKLFRKKSVITLYEVENLMGRRAVKLLNKADQIIVISDSLKEYAEKAGLRNVEVISPWIEIKDEKFNQNKLKEQYGLKGKKIILFIGRIIKTKGVEYLIKAMPEVKKKCSNAHLVMIGNKIDQELLELPAKLGIAEACEFKGFVTEKEKEDYCKLCDTLVYPPYVKGGFGFVLLEAMKYGKTVIGSDNWGVPDAVGDAGIIIPQKNQAAMNKALITILTNDKIRNDYAKKAITQAKRFEKKKVLNEFKKILLE
ncbi:MAG: glycosyltransferase family 4 protein [Candidatus Nanoarchaeia archaeon]|jgi:glycosyltransferase involved in cell wall biosynthesis